VVAGRADRIDRYLAALAAELGTLGRRQALRTLFLGGGTPTHLQPPQLARLLNDLRTWFAFPADVEFSVEANPGTLAFDKLQVLAEHGVNRLSLGAQAFHRDLLRFLERDHEAADIARAVASARRLHLDVSLDLIFGVPGQTLAHWRADLDRALALEPDHISTYGLTYEKGTRLWKSRRAGAVRPLDEDAELAMYHHAMDRLDAAGFEHYEISNFARPGKRSVHNQVYWANHAYFGFGLGAARYIEGVRCVNTRDLDHYLKAVLAGETAVQQREALPPRERALETVAVQLRRGEGIERGAFQVQTGFGLEALVGHSLAQHLELGLLQEDAFSVRLTRRGKCVADAVIAEIFAAAAQGRT